MILNTLDRKPTAYDIVPEINTAASIEVDRRGTVSIPGLTRLTPGEAKEIAMSVLFAAALAQLEGNRSNEQRKPPGEEVSS
jgi:hypothetical protein